VTEVDAFLSYLYLILS